MLDIETMLRNNPSLLASLLRDAKAALSTMGMSTLASAVGVARKALRLNSSDEFGEKLSTTPAPLTGNRVEIRKEGNRGWWQTPIEAREQVLSIFRMASPENPTPLQADAAEAVRAAIELLTPDWRTSILTQLATVRSDAEPREADQIARAQDALELHHRPVFEADARDGVRPIGLEDACEGCGAPPGTYCDPERHPEVPGDG